ncbi:hypothetical protein [Streptomyces sp. NPDC001889]
MTKRFSIRRFRLPRLRGLMIPLLGTLTTLAVTAPAAAADDGDTGKYAPGGVGDLMPSPLTPPGQGTLFEMYEPSVYRLDKQLSDDLTGGDLIDSGLHEVASMLLAVLTMVGRAAVTITQWCFNVVSLPEVEPHITRAIEAAAEPMAAMFLPAAVAVGAFIAWARRSDSSVLGQLAWVAASAAIATTFLTAPATWVQGVDTTRQAGSTVAMTAVNGGLSGDTNHAVPFRTPTPQWSGNEKDDTLRQASDSVWRTYVVVPWCIADLGSIEACKRWGAELLEHGSDMDRREDYLADKMTKDTVGHDAVQWRQGHNPAGRIGVLLAGVITAVIFCALVIVLAATTLASLLGALMLLICGTVFAALWCIPGRCRQWGVGWFETLVGLILASFTATLLLGAVMVTNVAFLGLMGTFGWLMVSCLNIAAVAMAFKLKGVLDGLVSAGGAQLAGRGVLGTIARVAETRRLRKAMSGSSGPGGRSLPGTPPTGAPAPDPGRTQGGTATQDSGPGNADHTIRVQRTRTYPPPPQRPELPAGTHGDHAATRPGLPGGPGGPPGQHPAGDTPPARTAKADLAREKMSTATTAGAAAPGHRPSMTYPVRPGAPDPGGVPHHPRQDGPKVIRGEVVTDPNAGARFRTYPPPASASGPTPATGSAPALVPAAIGEDTSGGEHRPVRPPAARTSAALPGQPPPAAPAQGAAPGPPPGPGAP